MTTGFFEPPDPAASPAPAPWVAGKADDIVPGLLNSAESLAQTTALAALNSLAALANFHPVIPVITTPTINATAPTPGSVGQPPANPGLVANFPAAPVEPIFSALPGLSLPEAPTFEVTEPLISDVPLPDPLDATLPDPPVLDNPDTPVEPGFELPPVPDFLALDLPTAPTFNIPLFEEELEEGPVAPDVSFAWSEVEYNTTLLSTLNSRLLDIVQGKSTGLAPEVEAAIWQRARDRETLLTKEATDEAQAAFAARGFTIPSGVLLRTVQRAIQESLQRQSTLSRDVMIKQAELEQSNLQFSITAAISLETTLIGHFNAVRNRSFEGLKFSFEAQIQLFNAKVALRQADVQAFVAKAQVFETRLKAELANLEVYKAELEAQRTVSEINKNQAALYEARVAGVRAIVEVYRERVNAVKVRVESDSVRADVYRSRLQGFDSIVKAKTSEYEAYGERVKAELTKVEMFGRRVDAQRSQVEAFKALVDAKLAEQNFHFKELQEFPLELWKGRVSAYGTSIQSEGERLRALANVFATEGQVYGAVEAAKNANDRVKVDIFQAQVTQYTAQAQVAIQASVENVKAMLAQMETIAASMRAAGQLYGQLAAAALSARHVSASLSSAVSNSASNSASNNASNTASNSSSRNASVNYDGTKNITSVSEVHTYKEK